MQHKFEHIDLSKLNHLQVGRIGEYWVKLWLTLNNFDTYYSDVDDKGIDFVIRLNYKKYIDVQVKTIRAKPNPKKNNQLDYSYVYILEESWKEGLCDNLYVALVILKHNEEPSVYFIPSIDWKTPNELLIYRKYEGKKSKPEWGINISQKNMELLAQYDFSNFLAKYKSETSHHITSSQKILKAPL